MYTESLQTLHKFRSRYKKSVDVYVVSIDATNFLQTLQKIRRYYWQTSVSTVDIGIYCRHCRHRSTRVKGNLSLFSLLVSSLLSLLSSSFSISSVLYIQIECQRLQQRRHVYQYTSMSTKFVDIYQQTQKSMQRLQTLQQRRSNSAPQNSALWPHYA